jgi:prepilin-type N-terminal cleavage/methylation domain-containing protein
MKKNKAFSLIELSIVLIIIGLLIAGVSGGKNLIESSKIQAGIKDIGKLKTAINSFIEINDRMPGSKWNNDNIVGRVITAGADCCNHTSASLDIYGGDWSGKKVGSAASFFVELYLAGVYNFKPSTAVESWWCDSVGITHPKFEGWKNGQYCNQSWGFSQPVYTALQTGNLGKMVLKRGHYLSMDGMNNGTYTMDCAILKKYDKKMDDGEAFTGEFMTTSNNDIVEPYKDGIDSEIKMKRYSCQGVLIKVGFGI